MRDELHCTTGTAGPDQPSASGVDRSSDIGDALEAISFVVDCHGIVHCGSTEGRWIFCDNGNGQAVENLFSLLLPNLRAPAQQAHERCLKTGRSTRDASARLRVGDRESIVSVVVQPLAQTGRDANLYLLQFTAEPATPSRNETSAGVGPAGETNDGRQGSPQAYIGRSSSDLKNLLHGTNVAAIFLDSQLIVRGYTPGASLIYPLDETSVGLPIGQLNPLVDAMPPLPCPDDVSDCQTHEAVLRNRGGRWFIRRVRPYQFPDGDAEGMVVTFSDVTELNESRSLLERSLNAAHMHSFEVDLRTGETRRMGSMCGPAGIPEAGRIEQFVEAVDSADRSRFLEARASRTAEDASYAITYRYHLPDGSMCWLRDDAEVFFDADAKPRRVVGTSRNVTTERRTLQELRKQQRQLQAITDAAPAQIAYVDSEEKHRFVNAGYARQFGKPVDQILGKTVLEVMGEQNYQRAREALHLALAGHRQEYELVLHGEKDEPPRFKEVSYVPDFGNESGVDGCYVLMIDVTQQKQDAVAALDRESQLKLALQTARMGIWEWDFETNTVKWSESLKDFLGHAGDHSRLTSEQFFRMVHVDDRDRLRQRLQTARDGTSESFEVQYRVTGGGLRGITWFHGTAAVRRDESGQMVNIICVVKDVTERMLAEERLAVNEHRLQRVIDGASVGIAFAKTSGQVVTANDAALRMLGIDRETFIREGFNWTSSIRPEDRHKAASIVKELKSSGRMPPQELLLRHPGGNLQPVQISSLSVTTDDEEHVVFLVDLAEQKRYQQSLDEARQLAETANETKSEFLANMSHEIRTPMSAIIGYLDILSRNLTQPDDLKCVSIIRDNSRFLLEIINDILDISKIEAGKLVLQKKRFRPDRLIADVRSLMDVRAAEKDLQLNVEFDGEIPKTIRSDDKRLKQILVNLLGNAIKFTEEGSVDLVIRYIREEEALSFDIIDTGIGMHPKLLAKLFQPFTQGDSSLNREFGGTGLGLTISQRLAHLLGGRIVAESQTGKGSKFSLRIAAGSNKNVPLVQPNLMIREASAQRDRDQELPRFSGRILVVDDRRDIRLIAQHIIEQAGGTVTPAEHGDEAIRLIRAAEDAGSGYDLVVMDMQMPIMDGYEATRRLRAAGFQKPIVALTAHAMRGDRQKCIDAGCTEYLTKPLDQPEFLKILASYLLPKAHQPRGPRRILVVEDLVEAADSLAMLLECENHVVEKAYDGTTAIELAEAFQPELVLLDLGLPDMSGYDVLRAIKRLRPSNGPVFVALTGRDNPNETMGAGFAHHIVKPVDINELERLVAALD
jgi:PAS domain S-box-containing protein